MRHYGCGFWCYWGDRVSQHLILTLWLFPVFLLPLLQCSLNVVVCMPDSVSTWCADVSLVSLASITWKHFDSCFWCGATPAHSSQFPCCSVGCDILSHLLEPCLPVTADRPHHKDSQNCFSFLDTFCAVLIWIVTVYIVSHCLGQGLVTPFQEPNKPGKSAQPSFSALNVLEDLVDVLKPSVVM